MGKDEPEDHEEACYYGDCWPTDAEVLPFIPNLELRDHVDNYYLSQQPRSDDPSFTWPPLEDRLQWLHNICDNILQSSTRKWLDQNEVRQEWDAYRCDDVLVGREGENSTPLPKRTHRHGTRLEPEKRHPHHRQTGP